MAGFPLGALISAGGSLLGGLFGSRSERKAQKQALAYQHYVNTHGIRMRVADAKAAGIHPLAALGASLNYATPSVVPGQSSFGDAVAEGAGAIGKAIEQALSEELKLERRKTEAEIRNLEANTMLQMARSRSEIATARRMAQSVDTGNMLNMDPFKGVKKQHGLMKTPADEVQREYDDLVSGVYGVLRFLDRWRVEPKVYRWSDGKYRTRPEPERKK